jgi:hypothetical protein
MKGLGADNLRLANDPAEHDFEILQASGAPEVNVEPTSRWSDLRMGNAGTCV